jgi:hypothetical protein
MKNMSTTKTTLTIASLASVAIITAIVFTSPSAVKAQAPPTTAPTTQDVDFTQLFQERFQSVFLELEADVIYQSPTTVVLEGRKTTVQPGEGLINNEILWQGVDIVKQHGYEVDSVTTSGLGTIDNPITFQVILSKQ